MRDSRYRHKVQTLPFFCCEVGDIALHSVGISGTKKQPREIVFGRDIPRAAHRIISGQTSGATSSLPNAGTARNNVFVCAGILRPVAPPERNSGETFGKSISKDWRKARRNLGEIYRRFSSFDFQGKWPQNYSRNFFYTSEPQIPQGVNLNSFTAMLWEVGGPRHA